MPRKKVIKEFIEDLENEEQDNQVEEIEEEVQEPEPIIKKRTNRKLILKEEAENGSDRIEKIVAYKKKTSDKQLKHMEKARDLKIKKQQEVKKKLSEMDLIKRENEVLKQEVALLQQRKRATPKKDVMEQKITPKASKIIEKIKQSPINPWGGIM